MTDMPIILHFMFSGLATVGFAVFFNTPARLLAPAGITGGVGWIVYIYLFNLSASTAFAGFIAGAFVSLCSEVLARKMKQPAIVFVIPGILPLIPGIGLYNTMLYMIQKNYSMSITKGTDAIFLSAAIALGVLVITSLVRTMNIVRSRQIADRKQKKLAQEAINAANSSEINPQINDQYECESGSINKEAEPNLDYEYEVLIQKSDSNTCYDDNDYNNSPSIDFDLDDLDPKPRN
ncbi:threonine/serine exporter family protein [Metaclostridioides mangenotii]|uniref:threonine/serine exporter family protein n=1 Tax=Metaclostridioides mangenotii TaxID=1540 RepID=UPI0026E99FFA|nr:threonine/serine exporter family protein [Clostridioides mangenotii]